MGRLGADTETLAETGGSMSDYTGEWLEVIVNTPHREKYGLANYAPPLSLPSEGFSTLTVM